MSMEKRKRTPEELKMLALYHQLSALSADLDVAGRVFLLGPTGDLIGTVSLSDRDVEAATDALASLNAAKRALEESTRPGEDGLEACFAEALELAASTEQLPEVAAEDVDAMLAEVEAFANRGDA